MKVNRNDRKRRIFILKIDLPALLAIFLFAGMIFLYLIPRFENVMMDRKRDLIHEMTSSAYSILEHFHAMELSGELETREAMDLAISAISNIRYGDDLKDYFWITDRQPRMIDHPYRPDLNGTDLTDFRDSSGKKVFVEFVNAVSATGENYVEYMWQWNDDSTKIVPKLSYVRLFEPWGWVIGTGIYIEDVRTEIRKLEMKALIITGLFGLVIFALLLAISRQSHKIEEKRGRAEEELRRSRELYRTLAEAATEGVIIWSPQGLQANKTLLSWVKYTEEELQGLSLTDILKSEEIVFSDDPDKTFNELSSRQYVACALRNRDGSITESHADFSRIVMGDQNAVLIVLRPLKSPAAKVGFNPPAGLFERASTGFFRLSYLKKARIIYVTEKVPVMLGYRDINEMRQCSIETLFAEKAQLEQLRQMISTGRNIYGSQILMRKKDGSLVWTLITIMISEEGSEEKLLDGLIEPLAASSVNAELPVTGYDEFATFFISGAPLTLIMKSPLKCSASTSLSKAAGMIKESGAALIVVLNSAGEPMGTADSRTIGFALAEGVPPESEIFRIMHAPPMFIRDDATVSDARAAIRNSVSGSLLVTASDNSVTGVITNEELVHASLLAPAVVLKDIAVAVSANGLKKSYLKSRESVVAMIVGKADPSTVSLVISSVADAICRKTVELCIGDAGEPPCRFAFIQTGSAGRMEQSLLTDQDNAILYEDIEGTLFKKAEEYFISLGGRVNEMLDQIGFSRCRGGNMAGNPRWCQPVSKWKKYFSDWIRIPGPAEILDVSIFFDFRFCFGDESLCRDLREYVSNSLKTNDIYFHHMSIALKDFNPSQSLLTESPADIKHLIMPLTGIIRLYALRNGLKGLSTADRIMELNESSNISHTLLLDALKAWKDLASIRFARQADCIIAGDDPDNIVDFRLAYPHLQPFAARAVETINNLMLMAGNDFHSVTI
jgi:signal-transduction protein with cAMP-binding, CBS, and nucleotidyltransferase domain/PAS domain-containing protein